MKELEKKWGLPTALSMVVGIVIGSGIFFKGVKVLTSTGGNMLQALMIIAIVGFACVICACIFANLGRKYSGCNGLVDYAEAALGKKFAYFVGWFTNCVYYPCISATLAYFAAFYLCMMIGLEPYGQANTSIGILFLFLIIFINVLAPKFAGKFQVSTTIIKLIPIISMALVGTIVGIVNGNGVSVFTNTSAITTSGGGIFAGICAFAFAYEGWIAATTINAELKNPKRDLPIALIAGCAFCAIIYVLYVYSMSATLLPEEIIAAGDNLPKIAFTNVFGNVVGNIIMGIIVISCLGTCNGMTLCAMRGFYSIAVRGEGPKPERFAEVDQDTGMPIKSCLISITLMVFWYFQLSTLYVQGPLVLNGTGNPEWLFAWEADEICIITMYALYIPIFVHIILKEKEMNVLNRFILPVLGIVVAVFMCYSSYLAYRMQIIYYLIFFAILQTIGILLNKKR